MAVGHLHLSGFLTISHVARKFKRSRECIRRQIRLLGIVPTAIGPAKLLSPADVAAVRRGLRSARPAELNGQSVA